MARLEIRLFGDVEARLDGALLRFPTQKAKELFAYLALHHEHAHPRLALAALLWPESDEEKAKVNLRKTLSRLRSLFVQDEHWLDFSGSAVRLKTQECWIDTAEFERLIALSPGDPKESERVLEDAVALYRGPFLQGVYEDWALIEAERFRTLYLEALERLASAYQAREAHEKALQTWKQVLTVVPWHERAHRELMTLYARTGDRTAALHQYREYCSALQRELGIPPLPETQSLYEKILQGALPEPARIVALPREIPFVGRERECHVLQTLWQRVCQGEGQSVMLGGEAGVGKTRLVEHFIELAARREITVLRGAASTNELPYAPLLQAVREGLRLISVAQLSQLPRLYRSELAPFVPELSERFPDLTPNPVLPPAQGKARWVAALCGCFELLARERPVILFLDDLQWADDATFEVLGFLMAHLKSSRIFLIGTYRLEETARAPLRQWPATFGAARAYQPLILNRLSQEEANLLLQRWLGGKTDALAAALYSKTEGNPLFLMELVHSLMRSGALVQDEGGRWGLTVGEIGSAHLSESLRGVIDASVQRVPQHAQNLIGLAAVLGRAFELPVLKEILRQPEGKILEHLGHLQAAGLIVERAGRYQFRHELIRQAVYEELRPDRRRLWHRKVGQALEELYPERSDELSGELAEHYERAQLWARAIHYAMRAGARAARSYAYGEAQRFYAKAIELCEAFASRKALSVRWQHTRLELYRRYLSREVFPTIYDLRRAPQELRRHIAQMIAVAQELKDMKALCEAYQHQARLELAAGQPKAAQEVMRHALAVAQRAHDPALQADVLQGVASMRARCGEYRQAMIEYQRYVEALAPLGDARRLGYALNDLALTQRACGDFAQAQKTLKRANEQFQRAGDLWGQAAVADNLGCIWRDLGRYAEAESSLQRALELNQATGDHRGVGCSLVDLGTLRNDQGRYEEALEFLDRVVAMVDQPGMKGLEIEACSEKARAHLGRGELALALEYSTRAMRLLEAHGGVIEQAYRFYFTHACILQQLGQQAEARRYLKGACKRLQQAAGQAPTAELRENFLHNVPLHRQILAAYYNQ